MPSRPDLPAAPVRPYVDLLLRQLAGIDAWHDARRVEQRMPTGLTREQRLDLSHREQARRREHAALVSRTEVELRCSGDVLRDLPAPRMVLAHRDLWLARALRERLQARGVEVLAVVDDGAAAVGTVVVEQPDLVLLEDRLPTLSGTEVVQRLRRLAPQTLVAVHHRDDPNPLSEAGAHLLLPRRASLDELADALLSSLDRAPGLVPAG